MAAGADRDAVELSSRPVGSEGKGVSALSSANITASRALISAVLIDPAPVRVDDLLRSDVTLMMDDSCLRLEINWLAPSALGQITDGHAVTSREDREVIADRYTLTSK